MRIDGQPNKKKQVSPSMDLHMKCLITIIMAALLSCFLCGCVITITTPAPSQKLPEKQLSNPSYTFKFNKCQPASTNDLVKKVDNFIILLDTSASMTEGYHPPKEPDTQPSLSKEGGETTPKGISIEDDVFDQQKSPRPTAPYSPSHENGAYSKFEFAKQLVHCLNQAIPDLEFLSALRTFGEPAYLMLYDSPKKYNKIQYANSLKKLLYADGAGQLGPSLQAITKDFFEHPGKTAVIVISDGKNMGKKEVFEAEELKIKYGEDFCIYTIMIGNDSLGEETFNQIAMLGGCGGTINGELLLEPEQMHGYIQDIFMTKDNIDADGNAGEFSGVQSLTPKSFTFYFENGTTDLTPESRTFFFKALPNIKKRQSSQISVMGHTDRVWSERENMELSMRRANYIADLLTAQGIEPSLIEITYYGEISCLIPTKDEVAEPRNRRVEVVIQ